MTDLSAPIDQLVAQMNHAGIDKAVLHTGHTYGRLNRFISEAIRRFPDRLWGMALVDEWRINQNTQLEALDFALDTLRLSGLWFDTRNIYFKRGRYGINHPALYSHLGVDVDQARAVVVKTASNFQHFAPWRRELIRVDSPGMTQSDLAAFEWRHAPRPLYPLDAELADWQA